ncbi:hypothetical protein B0H17DRAFT_1145728 [Mycena rosella]|uniref:Uncharacterized protein n=1 Tax=Mycena rosella TaxID=1033263 RepID=A0AAD7CQ83_MYCRO|nr:hypothetical protein B0H17DRAFT_1145728 [Mycena rosella]
MHDSPAQTAPPSAAIARARLHAGDTVPQASFLVSQRQSILSLRKLRRPSNVCLRETTPSHFVYGVKDTATRDRLPTSAQDDEHRDVGLATTNAHRSKGSTRWAALDVGPLTLEPSSCKREQGPEMRESKWGSMQLQSLGHSGFMEEHPSRAREPTYFKRIGAASSSVACLVYPSDPATSILSTERSVDQPPVGKMGGIPSKDSPTRTRDSGKLAANPDASFGLDSDVVPYHIGKRRMTVVAIVRWRQPESRQSGAVGVEPARRAGLSNRACGPASEKKDVQRSTPPDPLARFRGRACEAYREERRKLKIDSHTYLHPGRLLRICREDADRYSARKTLQVLRKTSTARNRLEEEGHAMETKVDVLRTTRGQENLVIPSLAASNCHLRHLRIPPTSHRGDIYHVSGCPGEMGSDGTRCTRWTSGLKEEAPHVPDRARSDNTFLIESSHLLLLPCWPQTLRAGYGSEALLPPVQPVTTGSTRPSEPRITHAGRLTVQPVGPLGSGARREAFRKRTSSPQMIATPTPPQFAQGYYLEPPLGKLFSLLQFTPPPSLTVTAGASTRHPCLERSTAPRYHSAIP